MSFVQINRNTTKNSQQFALFNLGFRPFFVGASIFTSIAIAEWLLVYGMHVAVDTSPLSSFEWHAHQMIYGFSMAVIAGFLLTAIMNWTGQQTIEGTKLKALVGLWAVPRIAFLFGNTFIVLAAVFDLLFFAGLLAAISLPIAKARQWKQLGILTKILLLGIGNLCFYLDAFHVFSHGAFIGVYGGLFLIISLILTIGGRVMPAFIRNGLDQPVEIKNPFWVTWIIFLVFLIFTGNYLFIGNSVVTGSTALILFVINSYRLYCWHTRNIWSKPLLWGLYCAYLFITFGFFLFALQPILGVPPFIAIHAFAYGGIGLATLAMMARVSLGHTGRSIRIPPRGVTFLVRVLTLGALVRVVGPVFYTGHYVTIIIISQLMWIIAFAGFGCFFWKILVSPRIDGQPG